MTIAGRLTALERRATERMATTGSADDLAAWWNLAPEAVLVYYLAVDDEVRADPRWDAHEAHPLLSRVVQAVQIEVSHHGQPVNLRRVQWWLLSDATYRLHAVVAKERGRLYDPETSRQTWRRLYDGGPPENVDTIAGKAWNDRTGETWVRVWRECGTNDPEVLRTAGLHVAELALLEADQ